MGLIRKALVAGGILFALPSPPQGERPGVSDAFATLSAASDTVADLQGFCDRRAQACVTGLYFAEFVKGKVQYSAKLIYEWANVAAPETEKLKQTKTNKKTVKDAPPLRLATIAPPRPKNIEDLLKGAADELP